MKIINLISVSTEINAFTSHIKDIVFVMLEGFFFISETGNFVILKKEAN